jgi:CBS domain containing-hemolysin-like protein
LDSDPLPMWLSFVFIILLIVLNGFFVATEFALVKVRGTRIESLAEEGNKRAKFARSILHNLDAYLSASQLGITLASLALGWIGEPAFARLFEPLFSYLGLPDAIKHTVSFLIAFSLMTMFHITLGEQAPKTYAIRKAENVTLLASGPMILFYKIMFPFIWILNGLSTRILKMAGIEPTSEHGSAHTEEEIRILMKESHKSGHIDNTELTLVDNIFDFAEKTARQIMIPRTDMACLYANKSYQENLEIALREMRTRYPVCDPDKDNIVGFIHIKDLFKPNMNVKDIKKLIRPITAVPESIPISDLLKLMQKKKTQMALLIDEYGGTSGLVTLEDIIEEIVGDIQDEFNQERPSIEKLSDNTYSIDGLLLIEEVNSYFGLDIDNDDYDTIGGWIYSQIEVPPTKGQIVNYNNEVEFVIEETDHRRISRILVREAAHQTNSLKLLG